MRTLHLWWISLSGESRAAIIAAVVSPTVAELFGLRVRMIEWFYMRTLEMLAEANRQLDGAFTRDVPGIINVSEFSHSTEELARQAGVWKWRARAAIKWEGRRKRF